MKCFIRAAEVWLPAQDHTLLEFGAGLFGEARSFAAVSRAMCFGRDEGLPGEAWESGHPVLLKQFEGSHFRRTSAAKVAGLTCAVAVPFFVAGQLTAVVTLFGSDDAACKGGIELWRNDPRISSDISLLDAYYGGLTHEFEQISRDAYLPRGMGLPGLAWQRDEVVITGEAGTTTRFLRGDAATDAGIRRALAMPCHSTGNASYVLMLLSGDETPIARRMERWVVDRQAGQLLRAGGHCEQMGRLDGLQTSLTLVDLPPVVSQVLASGTPALSEAAPQLPGEIGQAAEISGAKGCLWLPVAVEDKVTELLALYL